MALVAILILAACHKDDVLFNEPESEPMEEVVDLRCDWVDYFPLVGFQPEGIAVGNGLKAYVGGFLLGGILELDLLSGQIDTLVQVSPGSITIGLAFDARTKYLYAAGGSTGQVRVYNSLSGALVQNYQVVPAGTPFDTWLNDLVVTRRAVYVTSSLEPTMYKIPLGAWGQLPDASDIEAIPLTGDWIQETVPPPGYPVAYNANGIDGMWFGQALVVVNSTNGNIYKVNPSTGNAQLITLENPFLLPDGIILRRRHCYQCGFDLYVAQNANAVSKLVLDNALTTGELVETIVDPDFDVPTTIAMRGNGLYVVNARFGEYNPFELWPDVEFSVVRIDN